MKTIEGIKMPEAEYRAHPAINISTLKEIENSPAHYLLALDRPSKQTKAMAFGSAFHCLMLERNEFGQRYHILENTDGRTKAYKEEVAANADKIPISKPEHETLKRMIVSLRKNPRVVELMQDTDREVTFFGQIDGHECKCKVDAVKPGFLIDVKTTESAHPKKFAYSMQKYGYLYQAEFYMALTGIDNFFVIAVEKSPPYANNIFALSPSAERMSKIKEWLSIVADCEKSGLWPAFDEDVHYLGDE